MSPIIHGEIGWLCGAHLPRKRDRVVVTLASLLPDVDGVGLLVSQELYAAWHHKLAHGALAGVLFPVIALAITKNRHAAALTFLSFHLHVLADLVGSGPGWPIFYFWPWSLTEWLPSWQWDLASWQNAVIGMAITFTALGMALKRGRTPVELFSSRADAAIVKTLVARLRPGQSISEEP